MTMPSREFLVRQAVLNALSPYAEFAGETAALKLLGTPRTLRAYVLVDWVRPSFCAAVILQFNALVSRFQSQETV